MRWLQDLLGGAMRAAEFADMDREMQLSFAKDFHEQYVRGIKHWSHNTKYAAVEKERKLMWDRVIYLLLTKQYEVLDAWVKKFVDKEAERYGS
jgi:hypothetical protein